MKRVLIIRLTAMGDVAMTSPVVSAACHAYTDVRFDVLSEPFFEPFFEKTDNLHFIGTTIRKNKEGVCGLWKLYRQLAANNYDMVLDLHDVLRTKVLRTLFRCFSSAKVFVVDKGRKEKSALVRDNNKVKTQLKATVNRYAEVFAKAGLPVTLGQVYMSKVSSVIADNARTSGQPLIGVSPFAQHQGKVYPLDKMKEVVQILVSHGASVLIFGGGPKEKTIAEEWESDIKGCQSVIGKMKLREEMDLMSNLDCMISMDSSAMHLCSLFGVRVVSVWGATHQYAGFLGYRQNSNDVVDLDLDCRPCSVYGKKPCKYGDYRCFNISPQTIADKALSVKMA